jgi:hypothetical protein
LTCGSRVVLPALEEHSSPIEPHRGQTRIDGERLVEGREGLFVASLPPEELGAAVPRVGGLRIDRRRPLIGGERIVRAIKVAEHVSQPNQRPNEIRIDRQRLLDVRLHRVISFEREKAHRLLEIGFGAARIDADRPIELRDGVGRPAQFLQHPAVVVERGLELGAGGDRRCQVRLGFRPTPPLRADRAEEIERHRVARTVAQDRPELPLGIIEPAGLETGNGFSEHRVRTRGHWNSFEVEGQTIGKGTQHGRRSP